MHDLQAIEKGKYTGIYSPTDKDLTVIHLLKPIGNITDIVQDDEEEIKKIINRVKYVYYHNNCNYVDYNLTDLYNDNIVFGFKPVEQTLYSKIYDDLSIDIETIKFGNSSDTLKLITIKKNDVITKNYRINCNNKAIYEDETIAESFIYLLKKKKRIDNCVLKKLFLENKIYDNI